MAVLNSVGIVGLQELRRHSGLPIHGHRAGWGYLSRCPELGWDYAPWQMIWRLLGADHLHVNGLCNKFSEPDESVIEAARAVLQPISNEQPMRAMPVFSSGQTGLQAADTYRAIGTADLIHTAGGGIFAHPGGVSAGVEALREAWVAALDEKPIADHAKDVPSLSAALEFWQ
jgi:ribulose-bisphosphate carboxylase large chain